VVDQLLRFIGDIDWNQPDAPIPCPVDDAHPFRPVFDAITLIKEELDAILEKRRLAEKALLESQQCFEEVLKHSRDVLFKRDSRTGAFEYMSDAVNEIMGISAESVCRKGLDGIKSLIHPEDLPRFLAFHKNLQESSDPKSTDHLVQYRMRDSQGKYRWLSETAAVIRDAKGNPAFVIGSNRDVSHIKALELESREMTEQLLRSRKLEAVSTLAGGVAHNFNNLLMVVLGNLELMRMDVPPGDTLHRHIDAAEQSAQRAANLSTLMLTYVGQTKIRPQAMDLNHSMSEMVDVLKTTAAGSATLTMVPAPCAAWINADSGKLFQMISNLVTNAVEASGDQPLEIIIRIGLQHVEAAELSHLFPGEQLPEGSYVSLQVADNGCGMDTETLDKVFDPFFTTKFTGRGLGMATVMGIMRAHHGGAHIDSHINGGTTVTVYFPAHPQRSATPDPRPAADNHRRTVLLVDDEPLVLELGKQMLRRLGCDVLTAVDGFEALSVFEANCDQIHLAVLDIEMPRMDGRQTLVRLREIGAQFPVLVATGFIEAQAREKLRDVPVDGFIQKPFHVNQLQQKLNTIFRAAPS
jgi:PAS domain S-box-containing protein